MKKIAKKARILHEFVLLSFVLMAQTVNIFGQAKLNYSGWNLIRNYEFNYNNFTDLSADFSASTDVRMCSNLNEPVLYTGTSNNILYNTPLNGQLTLRATRISPFTTPCPPGSAASSATPFFQSAQIESKAEPITDSCPWRTGFRHGLFEIRCKLPDVVGIFPAFWLYLGTDEIDIFEFERHDATYTSAGNRLTNNLIDWPTGYATPEYTTGSCPNNTILNDYQSLFQDFHTYSLTWTPVPSVNPAVNGYRSRLTFYIDGVEIRTDTLYRDFGCNLQVIANLSMIGLTPSSVTSADMVIDYIRVYQKNDYTNQRSMFDFTTYSQPNPSPYNSPFIGRDFIKKGSNENYIYYQSTGGKIIRLGRSSNNWTQTVIQTPLGNDAISGSMAVASDNSVVYRGSDGRLKIMYITSGSSYANGYIDDNWSISTYKVNSSCNAISIGDNDFVFYKGADSKMHIYYWDVALSDWIHRYPGGASTVPPNSENVNGDIGIGLLNSLYYKGTDNKIHTYYKSGPNWIHTTLLSGVTYSASTECGSLAVAKWGTSSDQVFFRNSSNKMQTMFWKNNGWQTKELPFKTGWEIGGDINVGINNHVYYRGTDGSLQMYFSDENGTWYHYWVNEAPIASISNAEKVHLNGAIEFSKIDNINRIFYIAQDGKLSTYEYFLSNGDPTRKTPCGYDPNNPQVRIKRKGNEGDGDDSPNPLKEKIQLFPNPSNHEVNVLIPENLSNVLKNSKIQQIYIFDTFGRKVKSLNLDSRP